MYVGLLEGNVFSHDCLSVHLGITILTTCTLGNPHSPLFHMATTHLAYIYMQVDLIPLKDLLVYTEIIAIVHLFVCFLYVIDDTTNIKEAENSKPKCHHRITDTI